MWDFIIIAYVVYVVVVVHVVYVVYVVYVVKPKMFYVKNSDQVNAAWPYAIIPDKEYLWKRSYVDIWNSVHKYIDYIYIRI